MITIPSIVVFILPLLMPPLLPNPINGKISMAIASSGGPAFTVTENGAIHITTRVDDTNVHYYRGPGETDFSSDSGSAIPLGRMFHFNNYVFMVNLLGSKVIINATPEGKNDWDIVYSGATNPTTYKHFNAVLEDDKLYVYLMENIPGDACPLHLQVYNLSEGFIENQDFIKIEIEAED